ncbi:gluconokinase [Photobacterium sagamiensis]|uniref:gluconokinase n=1 Tax=Photobacterium sagamiensis TaxID=2910241 RepID=UPI003D0FCFEE
MNNKNILVMGVSGCGKSLIGSNLAAALDLQFFDGDDFHPQENVEKMKQGIPLTDDDRFDWLKKLNQVFRSEATAVIACSALKPEYRDILRQNNTELTIIYLQGNFETIWDRHKKRADHYFNGHTMLKSQFATLVEPEQHEAIFIDICQPADQVLTDILEKLVINQ